MLQKQRNVYCDEDTSNINEADVVSLGIQDLNKEVQYMSKAQTEICESLDVFCNTVRQLLKVSLFADNLLRKTQRKTPHELCSGLIVKFMQVFHFRLYLM